MVFKKRKINIETLAEYLSSIREDLGMSKEQAALASSVNIRFLEMLEKGDFSNLPPAIYVCGFLRQLAEIYSVAPDALIEQFKKESIIAKQVTAATSAVRIFPNYKQIAITPKLIALFAFSLFILITVGYVGYEVRSVSRNPVITITTPDNGGRVAGAVVRVAGLTDSGNQLSINGKEVVVADNGGFEATVSLSSGQTVLDIIARNKFNKVSQKTISLVSDNSTQTIPALPLPASLAMDIEVLSTVTLEIISDGKIIPPFILKPGEVKHIGAKDRILLSTSDAGSTKVVVNGKRVGTLGRVGEELREIPFTPEIPLLTKDNN